MKPDDGVADGIADDREVVIAAICDASPLGTSFFILGFFGAVALSVFLAVSFEGSGIRTSSCRRRKWFRKQRTGYFHGGIITRDSMLEVLS